MLSSSAVDRVLGIQTGNHRETHRPWTPGVRPPRIRPNGFSRREASSRSGRVTFANAGHARVRSLTTELSFSLTASLATVHLPISGVSTSKPREVPGVARASYVSVPSSRSFSRCMFRGISARAFLPTKRGRSTLPIPWPSSLSSIVTRDRVPSSSGAIRPLTFPRTGPSRPRTSQLVGDVSSESSADCVNSRRPTRRVTRARVPTRAGVCDDSALTTLSCHSGSRLGIGHVGKDVVGRSRNLGARNDGCHRSPPS